MDKPGGPAAIHSHYFAAGRPACALTFRRSSLSDIPRSAAGPRPSELHASSYFPGLRMYSRRGNHGLTASGMTRDGRAAEGPTALDVGAY